MHLFAQRRTSVKFTKPTTVALAHTAVVDYRRIARDITVANARARSPTPPLEHKEQHPPHAAWSADQTYCAFPLGDEVRALARQIDQDITSESQAWFKDHLDAIDPTHWPVLERKDVTDWRKPGVLWNLFSAKWRSANLGKEMSKDVRYALSGRCNAQGNPGRGWPFSGFGALTSKHLSRRAVYQVADHLLPVADAIMGHTVAIDRPMSALKRPPAKSGALAPHIDSVSLEAGIPVYRDCATMQEVAQRQGVHCLAHVVGGITGARTRTVGNLTPRRMLTLCYMFKFGHGDLERPSKDISLHDYFVANSFPNFYKGWARSIPVFDRVICMLEQHTEPTNEADRTWLDKVTQAGLLDEVRPSEPVANPLHLADVPMMPDGHKAGPYIIFFPRGIPHWVDKTGRESRLTILVPCTRPGVELTEADLRAKELTDRWLTALVRREGGGFDLDYIQHVKATELAKKHARDRFQFFTGAVHREPWFTPLEHWKYIRNSTCTDPEVFRRVLYRRERAAARQSE